MQSVHFLIKHVAYLFFYLETFITSLFYSMLSIWIQMNSSTRLATGLLEQNSLTFAIME